MPSYVDGPASYRRPPLLNARKRGRSTPSKFSSKANRALEITSSRVIDIVAVLSELQSMVD